VFVSSQYFRFIAGGAAERRRSALLEKLLARADAARPVSDWRVDAFRVIAPQAPWPAVAPAALCADRGAVDTAWVCMATPVHYVAEMTSVRLPQGGILSLAQEGAETLAADFNRVWAGSGVRLAAGRSARLYCFFDQALHVTTRDPQDVLDRHIEEYLPTGADAPRLRQLMSEIEMWLFEHGANSARTELKLPPINGLWLWGGGAPLSSLPKVQGSIVGEDLFFNALRAANEKSAGGVIIAAQAPGSDGWNATESGWLKDAAAQLRAGRISRLEISAGDRCLSLSARALWRFWRNAKPWWECFA
jgi:hypothetical protein